MSLDEQRAALQQEFPDWEIWYVPLALGGTTWCANPWAKVDNRRNVLHADTADRLAVEITNYQAEHPAEFPGAQAASHDACH